MSALEGIVTSPKVNRYLPWVAGLVLLAGVISFVVVHYSNTVPANPSDRLSSKPATQETSLGKAISLPKSARSVAARFIDAGVRGHDPQLAYRLSGPEIRDGYHSLKQWMQDWKTVGVPIQPYPATEKASLSIDYARQHEIQLKFFLRPVKGSGVTKPQIFLMLLDRIHGRWLVNSWQTFSPPAIKTP